MMQESGLPFEVAAAADVSTVANDVYSHNHPNVTIIKKGIEALSVRDWERLSPDLVTMSPPCQPFTRQGLKRDNRDHRSKSFLAILDILPKLTRKPTYILIENVKGFEDSDTHEKLLDVLKTCCYQYQEFLLSPLQFGVPNQRLRYYLLASQTTTRFACRTENRILEDLPHEAEPYLLHRRPCQSPDCVHASTVDSRKDPSRQCSLRQPVAQSDNHPDLPAHESVERALQKYTDHCRPIKDYMESTDQSESGTYVDQSGSLLDEEQLRRYLVLDIVKPESSKSVCFTKSYSRQLEGSGSVLQQNNIQTGDLFAEGRRFLVAGSDELQRVLKLDLRFFTPGEVAKLMCFPGEFAFPEHCSRAQRYRTLGNSLNCHVVSVLLRLLIGEPEAR